MMHLKNGRAGILMEEVTPIGKAPKKCGAGASDVHQMGGGGFPILKKAGYEGWFAFETPHTSVGIVYHGSHEERGVRDEVHVLATCRDSASGFGGQ